MRTPQKRRHTVLRKERPKGLPHKRGAESYRPLLAFCAETKEIPQGRLRCGNACTSNGIVEFTKRLPAHLPEGTRILFRGDSGFFVGALLDLPDQYGHSYLIKVKLKGPVTLLSKQSREPVPGKAGREPWQIRKRYGQRATCETWIEEAKNQTAPAHIKTEDFWADSALFQIAIPACNTMRRMALLSRNNVLRRREPGTIRTFLIRAAGKYTTGGRQQKLSVPKRMLYSARWNDRLAAGLYRPTTPPLF